MDADGSQILTSKLSSLLTPTVVFEVGGRSRQNDKEYSTRILWKCIRDCPGVEIVSDMLDQENYKGRAGYCIQFAIIQRKSAISALQHA